jgi:hypothetical protein
MRSITRGVAAHAVHLLQMGAIAHTSAKHNRGSAIEQRVLDEALTCRPKSRSTGTLLSIAIFSRSSRSCATPI